MLPCSNVGAISKIGSEVDATDAARGGGEGEKELFKTAGGSRLLEGSDGMTMPSSRSSSVAGILTVLDMIEEGGKCGSGRGELGCEGEGCRGAGSSGSSGGI